MIWIFSDSKNNHVIIAFRNGESSVVASMLDYKFVVSKFKLQLHYCVQQWKELKPHYLSYL